MNSEASRTITDEPLSCACRAAARPATAYFRKEFVVSDDPNAITSLTLRANYDDGFVAYLNGQEIARRSIAAGAVLCWARALGEFGATLTFAGSFPGVTRTMPLAVYAALDVDRSEAIALSVVLLLVSVAILVSLRGQFLQGLRR